MITELNERSREIFRHIVDAYMESGDPVGSRTISRRLSRVLSPATVRNVMADLEEAGLLFAPHASAGRLPTESGLKLFVDGLLELGNLTADERRDIEGRCVASGHNVNGLLEEVSTTLSGLTGCAGLVLAPKTSSPLKHIEFVPLSPGRALVVMVVENGVVENRIIETPPGMSPSALVEATNFLSARLVGRTLSEAFEQIMAELEAHRSELDALTSRVVEDGLAVWGGEEGDARLIVRGRANLLEDVTAVADLERIRGLFEALETKETMLKMLSLADSAEGVQIFIGSDNKLFSVAGCSMIVGSYQNEQNQVLGAIGVIGPTRMNYARIIPMVDFTAKLMGRMIG
ncbi:MAG: heat-inducible transcriptional repressor HrcA [Rhodospirillales bacterium]|nr:heat-inducible transcriptional repressor HrcA [Rhodospirillales bacterium]